MGFSAPQEITANTFDEEGSPVRLSYDGSHPGDHVHWQKDGEKPLAQSQNEIEKRAKLSAFVSEAAELTPSGAHSCEASGDQIEFKVDVAGDLSILRFVRITNFSIINSWPLEQLPWFSVNSRTNNYELRLTSNMADTSSTLFCVGKLHDRVPCYCQYLNDYYGEYSTCLASIQQVKTFFHLGLLTKPKQNKMSS